MGLGLNRDSVCHVGLMLGVMGVVASPLPANAGSVPAGGANWSIVNEVFAAAVRQQSVSNQGVRTYQPVKAPTARPAPVAADAPTEVANADNVKWGWLSEIRLGILKHSAPISTSTPKEKGIDGNIEILFASPGWLGWLWSPRPHIGASFNASTDDTDQVYTGLTWEWEPLEDFFIDASFGFAGHNGRLHIDSTDVDSGRRREFGCPVLLRESIEFGYRIMKQHSLSVMWDHVSHGGLCDDENEGMDNIGMRYGYRF